MTSDVSRLQVAVRGMSILLAFNVINDFISPALWILNEPSSVLSRVASLSSSAFFLATCWFSAGLLVLPFFYMQLFSPACMFRRQIMKLAIYGMILGALIWGLMAFLSRNLDYQFAIFNFVFNAVMSLGFATLMANGLNNDQIEAECAKKAAP